MDLKLRDKVALVTGGSRGLGRAVCATLAAEGARVVVNYQRSAAAAQEVVRQIAAAGGRAIAIGADVADEAAVISTFNQTEQALGPVDVLVNCAGVWPTAYVRDMSVEHWDATMAVNLRGPFLTCREALRRWLATETHGTSSATETRGTSSAANGTPGSDATPGTNACTGTPILTRGRIVNVTSQAAFHGSTTGHADYAASKAGLVTFTISLAREVARYGIYVNCVAPGMIETDMTADALKGGLEKYLARIPLGRIGRPEELADTVAFLASERASYTTGATFDVTGGMLMR